jgi:GT2 family glycosyltransferase
MNADEIGVVAIGRNEGARLIGCLTSIKIHTSNIFYVDSGSTDGSIAAAEELGVFVLNLDLSQPFTAARARNEGFVTLKSLRPHIRFVQFVDGDCTLVNGWLDKALAFIEQRKDVAVVCGRRRERYPTASIYNEFCDLEWDTPIGETTACGGDALVRVEAFEAVEGFRPQLIAGEEPELGVRLRESGWKLWRIDAEMTLHDAAISRFSQWWLRTVRCGYGFVEVWWLHRSSGIWGREVARATFWGGVLPVIISFGALVQPIAIGGILAYCLQICRIAFLRGPTSFQSWTYAVFMTVGKLAEFQGVLKFSWRQWRGKASTLIEYK